MVARKKTKEIKNDHPELFLVISDDDSFTASSYDEILRDVDNHLMARPNLDEARVYQLIHVARKTVRLDGPDVKSD